MTFTLPAATRLSARFPAIRPRRCAAVAAALVLSAAVAACNTAPPPKAEGKQLMAAELQALFLSGAPTITEGTSVDSGRQWQIMRDGAGAQSLSMAASDFTDTGTYRIEGDTVCSKWVEIRDGAEACGSIFLQPDGTYQSANSKGERRSVFTVTAGS